MSLTNTQRIIDAEKSVLGAVLLDDKVMDDVATMLEPRDFSTRAHELIWQAMKYLYDNDKPIDIVTLVEMLNIYKRLDEVGGVTYLTELSGAVPTTANTKFYADIVRKQAVKRRAATIGEKIRTMALEQEFENEEDFFQAIEKMAESIRPEGTADLIHMTEGRKEYFDYLQQQDDLIMTGFQQFDQWMGGIGRGWLYVLAARPSVGKTAKMLQMLRGIAAQGKGQCLVWSQEMKRPQLYNRMIASMTAIHANRLRLKKIDRNEMKKIEEAYSQLEKLPIRISDARNVTIEEIRATARQAKRKHGPIAAIFIDYLGIMNIPQSPGMTRAQAIGEVTKAAKRLAMELDCAVIMLAQMNREGKKALKPSLEHLKESGDIEQDADVVEFLWEDPEDTDPGMKYAGARVVQSIIAKGRDIGVNEFRYAFKGWTQEFVELPPLRKEE